MQTYYLLSIKHSPADNQALWWGPKDAGYTDNLDLAGVYTQAQIDANPDYYRSASTKPVPCEVARRGARAVVRFNDAHQMLT